VSSFASLDRVLAGRVHQPDTPGFGAACAGFDLATIPAPDVAIYASTEDDVATAVRFAADHGLPVAVRATGHGSIPGVDGGLLINTQAMSAVTVDPARRTATIGAGATWVSVLQACAEHGLAPLCGSAPGVGAVSYTLGGGNFGVTTEMEIDLVPVSNLYGALEWRTDAVQLRGVPGRTACRCTHGFRPGRPGQAPQRQNGIRPWQYVPL
jgi:FAD binding domain